MIELAVVEGAPFIIRDFRPTAPPEATVRIVSFLDFAEQAHFTVRGLRRQSFGDDAAYALYLTTRDSPEEYVHGEFGSGRHIFNVTGQVGDVQSWLGGHPAGITVDAPTITAFIAFEPDDGFAFNPVTDMDRVIFVGTSIRD